VASPFTDPGPKESEFCNDQATVRDSVKEFYRLISRGRSARADSDLRDNIVERPSQGATR